jgi:hypothetical protein
MSQFDTDTLFELALVGAEVEHGRKPMPGWTLPASIVSGVQPVNQRKAKSPVWSIEEDTFLTENLGRITEAEIAESLGRSVTAVHLRWERDLRLPAPSKAPDVLTANSAAILLGIDTHKIAHWCDMGMIPHRIMAGGREIRLINKTDFDRWVVNPENWVYFDICKITDPRLHKMCAWRAERWGDEWWTTKKVAAYHGVETGDVKRYLRDGRIKGFQPPYSLGGRNALRGWAGWFVLRSEATRPGLVFHRRNNMPSIFSAAADAWIVRAHDELHLPWAVIARTMSSTRQGHPTSTLMRQGTVENHYHQYLKEQSHD